MTDSGGPSRNVEQPGHVPNPQDPQKDVPSFLCVLPCSNPLVKYLDRLYGCSSGIHATREDIQDLHVIYSRMADAILSKDKYQFFPKATPDKCAVCKCSIVPSQGSPMLYMENCTHFFHCGHFQLDCSVCKVSSSRALIWPQAFPSASAKNELFQLQKRSFGLDVAPQTEFQVLRSYKCFDSPAFKLFVNGKNLTVTKGPSSDTVQASSVDKVLLGLVNDVQHRSAVPEQHQIHVDEKFLVEVIQDLHLVDQPRTFYLGDILPLEDIPGFRAEHPYLPALTDWSKRKKLLLQFHCPFKRQYGKIGNQCEQGIACEFWHDWPKNTPGSIYARIKIRQFPEYLCLHYTRTNSSGKGCSERIQLHPDDLPRCFTGFHPTTQDIQNLDGFANKIAKQIMATVVVPEQHLTCAFCNKSAESNSVWMHLQNCVHCLHVHCLPLVRLNNSNPNRKLDLHCPSCQVPSVRTMAWPGPFSSDMAKQAIFGRQLAEFKLNVQGDTQLAIVEVANKVNVFTLNYGGPNLVTIDVSTAQDDGTIYYN